MNAPAIIARNLKLVCGNNIVATVDLEIVGWRLVLRSCRWRKDGDGERVTLGPCDSVRFSDDAIMQRFQAAALIAIRNLAKQIVAP